MQRKTKRNNVNNQQTSLVREYAAPVLRKIDRPYTDVTLYAYSDISSGVTGTNGINVALNYSNFTDIGEMLGVYSYFEILGYKIDFSLGTTAAITDSFYSLALGLKTANYVIGEVVSSTVPTSGQYVMELPGSIWIQQGSKNFGKWCMPNCKQVFSVRDAYSNARSFGNLVAYANDAGVSELLGQAIVTLNVRFYGKDYSANT